MVEAGQKIKIEKDLSFDILWPSTGNVIDKNKINNNSLVCKMKYHKFSILFTGDIEEIAERAILQEYKGTLESSILKVAHHGSKSSSIEEFLKEVKPKIALIGVGEKNTFGHPHTQILERLQEHRCRIFRTDRDGEISIIVKKNGSINLANLVNNKKNE